MSFSTLLYVWDAFTFILFFVILLSSLQSKKDFASNKKLIVVSLFLFTGMFLFYREQYLLYEGKQSVILTFFTYAFSSLSHMLIVSLIVTLYTKVSLSKKVHILIVLYGICIGIIMAINVVYGSFLSTHVLIGIINAIPLIHLLVYVIIYDKNVIRNVFLYQIGALIVIYIAKSINIVLQYDSISFSTSNYHDTGFLMVANVVILSFVVSYLMVKNSMINKELEAHRQMIQSSLDEAIDLSEKDELTELYNRRKITKIINSYYTLSMEHLNTFSIMLVDVDKFKEINDTYGHIIGDQVLKYLSDTIKQILRNDDVVSRWGGDEFLILLPNTKRNEAGQVQLKIKQYLKQNYFEKIDSFISLSFGLAESTECRDLESLLHLADQRMYSDKEKVIEE